MNIRRAEERDAKEIFELRKNTFLKINSKDYTAEQIGILTKSNTVKKLIEKIKEREMFCLEDKGKILGVIDLEGNKIGGFFVRYDIIRKGYGKMLMRFIEDHARKKGIKKVILFSTVYAENFYKKQGYSLVKRTDDLIIDNVKFKKIKMEKEL